jgi:hypothetical protein
VPLIHYFAAIESHISWINADRLVGNIAARIWLISRLASLSFDISFTYTIYDKTLFLIGPLISLTLQAWEHSSDFIICCCSAQPQHSQAALLPLLSYLGLSLLPSNDSAFHGYNALKFSKFQYWKRFLSALFLFGAARFGLTAKILILHYWIIIISRAHYIIFPLRRYIFDFDYFMLW